MAKIENHKYTIEEAFKSCFYIVPDYQREYVWEDKEVFLLLDDIDEQVGSTTSEYFIGTVLCPVGRGCCNMAPWLRSFRIVSAIGVRVTHVLRLKITILCHAPWSASSGP